MAVVEIERRSVSVWDGAIELQVEACGEGPPVLFLHALGGLRWDPFLQRLAESYTVLAPRLPGTPPGDVGAIHRVHDLAELVLVYEEAIRALDLDGSPIVVGHCFGGMLAAELAAQFPALFSRVVLLDAMGLWRDDAPVRNPAMVDPALLPSLLFEDLEADAVQAALALPEDPDERIDAVAAMTWAVGCAAKFIWPIPDRGLRRRLHRVQAPTLIVWGEQDRLVPSVYAEEFQAAIAGSRVGLIPECGHIPQVEQLDSTSEVVRDFLADGG